MKAPGLTGTIPLRNEIRRAHLAAALNMTDATTIPTSAACR
jgi:hypothetical protein